MSPRAIESLFQPPQNKNPTGGHSLRSAIVDRYDLSQWPARLAVGLRLEELPPLFPGLTPKDWIPRSAVADSAFTPGNAIPDTFR